jgi:hypothetical protein
MVRTALTPPAETATIVDSSWVTRQPATSWPLWSKADRPGRCGMFGPKRNDRSALSTCLLNMPRRWSICWSMRYSIAAPLPRRTG